MSIKKAFLQYVESLPGANVFGRVELLRRFEGHEVEIARLLSMLENRGELLPIGRGLWQLPRQTRFGIVMASPENVVAALERNREIIIIPGGAKILNEIGASTQLPMRYKFMTTKRIRPIALGKRTIEFEYRQAFATAVEKLEEMPNGEMRRVAKLWVALDYAGFKQASSECDAFRQAFGALSVRGQQALLKILTGRLKWARDILDCS